MASLFCCAGPALAEEAAAPKKRMDTVSYGIGVEMGRNFKLLEVEIDGDMVAKGIKDAMSGSKLQFSEQELNTAVTGFQTEVRERQTRHNKAVAIENVAQGTKFLEANKVKDGVVTTPSGLQYKVIRAGNGKVPTLTDTVECNYRGTLVDGTEFDSSYKRGQPMTVAVASVIPGWKEALQKMPVGSKWQLFVPAGLAYGARGAGNTIGPNATLIFDVELLSIK
jgi:FKBP-type peptidyl-prolyl cis-trans isomerase FklB